MTRRLNIILPDQPDTMLKALTSKTGMNATAMIISMINERYDREIAPVTARKTPAQLAKEAEAHNRAANRQLVNSTSWPRAGGWVIDFFVGEQRFAWTHKKYVDPRNAEDSYIVMTDPGHTFVASDQVTWETNNPHPASIYTFDG